MKNIDDPTVHCLMPGIPRVVGMPFPLEIIQTPNKIVILYEAFRTFRVIPTDGKLVGGESAPSFNGDSVGHWEGDTLVVDVKNFNGKIWGPGNMKVTSDKYHVVERYTLVGDTLQYQVVIDDPGVLTGPFSPNPTTLRRPPETRIMEYECIENNLNLELYRSVDDAKIEATRKAANRAVARKSKPITCISRWAADPLIRGCANVNAMAA